MVELNRAWLRGAWAKLDDALYERQVTLLEYAQWGRILQALSGRRPRPRL